MRVHVLSTICTLLALGLAVIALPSSNRRLDTVETDDEPFTSDFESGLDLIAEESQPFESVVAAPAEPIKQYTPSSHLRGHVKFSESLDSEATPLRSRYPPPARYRNRKVTTTPSTLEDLEDEDVVKDEKERALMLVLPFNTRNLSESKIQELYTKAPVTWLINTTTTETPTTRYQSEQPGTTSIVTPTPIVRLPVFTTTTTTPAPPVIRDDVKELLASIGLFPAPVYTTPSPAQFAAESLSPDMKNLLASFGLLQSNEEAVESTPESDYEVQNSPVDAHVPVQAEIDPSSYSVFKPIPTNERKQEMSSDMKEFLASFGLVDEVDNKKKEVPQIRARGKKLHVKSNTTPSSPEAIPTLHPESMSSDMKRVLHTLGLGPQFTFEEIADFRKEDIIEDLPSPQARSVNSAFIFNPTDSKHNTLNSTEDVENLKVLLEAFKLLAYNTTNPEELEKQVQDATSYLAKHNLSKQNFTKIFANNEKNNKPLTLNDFTNFPDPLSFDELLYAINETKNEIHKRQEANTTMYANSMKLTDFDTTTAKVSSTSTTTEAQSERNIPSTSETTSAFDSSASEDSNTASLADLESSFGGSNSGGVVDESLPPPKPNGFYFTLDLNTFLNVGEEGKGVDLKLAPKLGNSRHFLPVTVP